MPGTVLGSTSIEHILKLETSIRAVCATITKRHLTEFRTQLNASRSQVQQTRTITATTLAIGRLWLNRNQRRRHMVTRNRKPHCVLVSTSVFARPPAHHVPAANMAKERPFKEGKSERTTGWPHSPVHRISQLSPTTFSGSTMYKLIYLLNGLMLEWDPQHYRHNNRHHFQMTCTSVSNVW